MLRDQWPRPVACGATLARRGPVPSSRHAEAALPTRRVFELILITVVLWDLGKGTLRLWERKTWAATAPGSISHEVADLTSIFIG
jgi:hypothetical protein